MYARLDTRTLLIRVRYNPRMSKFKVGDDVCFPGVEQNAVTGVITKIEGSKATVKTPTGKEELAYLHALLRPKESSFDLHCEILTTSALHVNELGQIVAFGTTANGLRLYKVLFSDGQAEWFGPAQIFIEDKEEPTIEEV